MAFYRNRLYKRRRVNKSYNRVRRYNASKRIKRTKASLNYKVYNLTRKVNKFIYDNRPELQQVRGNMIDTSFKTANHLDPIYSSYRNLYESTLQVYNEDPSLRLLNIQNDLCKSFRLRLFGYFGLCPTGKKYQNDPDTDDYIVQSPFPQECYLKIVIATLKKGGGRIPGSAEVFYTNNPPAPDGVPGFRDLCKISGPLNKNITSQLNILRTKVVKIGKNYPVKIFKMNLKVPHYRKRVNENAYGAGEILVYYQLLCPTYFSEDDVIYTPDPRFVLDYQLFYVDQN